jgi:CheY-like chemotaxis protein
MGSNMDVLVVDDDPTVRDLFKRALERAGFMVNTADNGLAAIAELQQQSYQAIICDVAMPFLEGRRFYDELKAANPKQAERVIFVTGALSDPNIQMYLEDSRRPFLGKPVPIAKLVAAVQDVARA